MDSNSNDIPGQQYSPSGNERLHLAQTMTNENGNDMQKKYQKITSRNEKRKDATSIPINENSKLIDVFTNYFGDKTFDGCNNLEDFLRVILKETKATKYVGAGVGGILVDREGKKVLLYRRYKDPDKGFWSMPGGGVKLGKKCEEILVDEFALLVGIKIDIKRLKYICVNNHFSVDDTGNIHYHYLSPAFLVECSKTEFEKIKTKREIPEWHEPIKLKWEKIEDIISEEKDKEDHIKSTYTFTTINALRNFQKTKNLRDGIEKILSNDLQSALKNYYNYSTYESTDNQ